MGLLPNKTCLPELSDCIVALFEYSAIVWEIIEFAYLILGGHRRKPLWKIWIFSELFGSPNIFLEPCLKWRLEYL